MQREISNKIRLGENLNLLRDVSNVPSIDNVANLRDLLGKVDKLGAFWDYGEADASLATYIPGLTYVSRQGQLYSVNTKKSSFFLFFCLFVFIDILLHIHLRT